jgi:hypothetical protein
MNALILTLAVFLLPVPAQPLDDELPGQTFSRPVAGTVLRAGPGANFAGALTLDGTMVVRVGELRGLYREVFVPQGYPVYMHGDYMAVTPADGTARVAGDRVNMRLLPSTEGLLPVGTLPRNTGPLVVLDRAGGWVRVLAPLTTPLYAPQKALAEFEDSTTARSRWWVQFGDRERRRLTAVEAWRAMDPTWKNESGFTEQAEQLADTDISLLNDSKLAERRARIDHLAEQTTSPETHAVLLQLGSEVDRVREARARAARAVDAVKRQQEMYDAALRREAKLLSLGFRFAGRGDVMVGKGSVHREGTPEAPVYTLHSTGGEILKLTAPADVATLAALAGKHVELRGRRLFLTTVSGPVLVIDEIIDYHR